MLESLIKLPVKKNWGETYQTTNQENSTHRHEFAVIKALPIRWSWNDVPNLSAMDH